MKNVLFVAFSHTLTAEQIADAKSSLNIDRIFTLKETNPELQKTFSNVTPHAPTQDVAAIAERVVEAARNVNATHFYCVGEPGVMYMANLLASNTLDDGSVSDMICINSTTKRESVDVPDGNGGVVRTMKFKHVQWRMLSSY